MFVYMKHLYILSLNIFSQIPISGPPDKCDFLLVELFSLVLRLFFLVLHLVSYQLRLSREYLLGPLEVSLIGR